MGAAVGIRPSAQPALQGAASALLSGASPAEGVSPSAGGAERAEEVKSAIWRGSAGDLAGARAQGLAAADLRPRSSPVGLELICH